MSEALTQLLDTLDLEKIDVNIYRGQTPKTRNRRVFGGQVFAQAMRAAQDTVPEDRMVHSQHAYFLRPGDPTVPILFEVDGIRDGKSFTTRRVVASQRGSAIFNTELSFQVSEQGFSHQSSMPECTSPEELEDDSLRWAELLKAMGREPEERIDRPIEMRSVNPVDLLNPITREAEQLIWIKTAGTIEDTDGQQDKGLHHAILAFASDYNLMATSLLPHGVNLASSGLQPASLDHCIWFHDMFRADEWLLYAMDSPRSSHARGLSRGSFFTRDGRLVASTIQEGLMRMHSS